MLKDLKELIITAPEGIKVSVILNGGDVWQHTREGFLSDEFGVDWAKATAEARFVCLSDYWGYQIVYNSEYLPFVE